MAVEHYTPDELEELQAFLIYLEENFDIPETLIARARGIVSRQILKQAYWDGDLDEIS